MHLCKVRLKSGEEIAAVMENDKVFPIRQPGTGVAMKLCDVLHAADPAVRAQAVLAAKSTGEPVADVTLLPPCDAQEVWAAGVTYKRSREARERESAGAARFYDLVYNADRPELFFKSPAWRVVGPGGAVRIRKDARWSVPEPELALVVSPKLEIVGYTIGNDMSSRDIEGENPLYLPQAKFYDGACALGPVITLAADLPPAEQTKIRVTIERAASTVFDGSTTVAAMKRTLPDLVSWLGRETSFPNGVILLTGTGVVPPDEFTLAVGDVVSIEITGIGKLTNVVR